MRIAVPDFVPSEKLEFRIRNLFFSDLFEATLNTSVCQNFFCEDQISWFYADHECQTLSSISILEKISRFVIHKIDSLVMVLNFSKAKPKSELSFIES